MSERCPHCNQVLPPKDIPIGVRLSPTQARIWDAVTRLPGMCTEDLFQWVYSPNDAATELQNVCVQISQLNKKLSQHGIQIRGHRTDGYKVVTL